MALSVGAVLEIRGIRVFSFLFLFLFEDSYIMRHLLSIYLLPLSPPPLVSFFLLFLNRRIQRMKLLVYHMFNLFISRHQLVRSTYRKRLGGAAAKTSFHSMDSSSYN